MQIIKDKQRVDNTWQFIADEENLVAGDITVTLTRWLQDKATLITHTGKVGLRLKADDTVADFADDLAHIKLVELNFADFADGRSFSQAWLLRGRYDYKGEIRAIGRYLPEQVFYLSRVGVNAYASEKSTDLDAVLNNLNDFTVKYQPSIV